MILELCERKSRKYGDRDMIGVRGEGEKDQSEVEIWERIGSGESFGRGCCWEDQGGSTISLRSSIFEQDMGYIVHHTNGTLATNN